MCIFAPRGARDAIRARGCCESGREWLAVLEVSVTSTGCDRKGGCRSAPDARAPCTAYVDAPFNVYRCVCGELFSGGRGDHRQGGSSVYVYMSVSLSLERCVCVCDVASRMNIRSVRNVCTLAMRATARTAIDRAR